MCFIPNKIKIALVKVLLIFLLLLNLQSGYYAFGEIVEEIYYLVNEDFITKLDFEEELKLSQKNSESTFNANNAKAVMSNLIIEKLIEKKLVENNLEVKNLDISNYINVIIERNNIGSIENFISILATSQNLSYDEYYTIIQRKLARQYYNTRIVSVPPINNREIEEYYQKNRETQFKIEEPIYNLSVITLLLDENTSFSKKLKTQNRLLEIKNEIQKKTITFEKAVSKYSEDKLSKSSFGLLGWVDPLQLGINPENLKIFPTLKKGNISDLIRNNKGISIYKVNEVLQKGYIPYELAIKESKNKVFEQKQKKAFNASLKELIESSIIVAKNPNLLVEFKFFD